MRCEQQGPAGVHLNSEVEWVKRMYLCIEGSIRIAYRKIVVFHLPSYSIAVIALLSVRKVTDQATTGKKVSVFGFAVEVLDKQGDNSSFFVIKDSKKGVDACSDSANPSAFPTILHSKGRITYLPSFSKILEDQTILSTCTSPLIAIALQKGTSIKAMASTRSCCALT